MNDVHYSSVDWLVLDCSIGLRHFGDGQVYNFKGTGMHKIEARLKEIPKCVSHLVFTLSSFRAPSILRLLQGASPQVSKSNNMYLYWKM